MNVGREQDIMNVSSDRFYMLSNQIPKTRVA